jgi:anti-sigma factor ChrR (cupin superfamily)
MSSGSGVHDQNEGELFLYALHALPARAALIVEAHVEGCAECRQELDALRRVIGAFTSWPTDVLRPATPLWERLAQRIGIDADQPVARMGEWSEPDWEEAAPGIWCKLLAIDAEKDRVSMLVRLEPGVAYPPHRHAGVEELYLLDGELTINGRTLYPGDYNRAAAETADQHVWSATGCTCVLITSTRDLLS